MFCPFAPPIHNSNTWHFCQKANKYEQILAQRVDGISHNLHLAFGRHEKIVEDDITSALVEHARSMISYERQRLRELEALRPDFANANKAYAAAAAAPRPAFISETRGRP